MHHCGNELDPLRHDTAFDQRARALVVGERDAQLEAGVSHEGIIPQNSVRAALILRSARKNVRTRKPQMCARVSKDGGGLMLRDAA